MTRFRQTRFHRIGAGRLAGILLALLAAGGCAELAGLNPYFRRQWAEDERVVTTFHTQLERIRRLQREAASMPADEQRRVAAELTRLIREDRSTILRIAALRTLEAFPADLRRTAVQIAATDDNAELRVVACEALRALGDPESVGLLASIVENDDNLDVRIAATRALAGFQDAQTFHALGIALDDGNPALQLRAMESLHESSGRDYGHQVALWRSWLRGENPEDVPPPSIAERLWKAWRF